MHADLDTLVTALYVTIDDLFGPRQGQGRPPKLSDSELVCLAVAQVLLGCDSERRWLRFARHRMGHLFPYLSTSSTYDKRSLALGRALKCPDDASPACALHTRAATQRLTVALRRTLRVDVVEERVDGVFGGPG